MGNENTVNWEQHRVTEKSARGIPLGKEHLEVLRRVAMGPVLVRAHVQRNGHVQIHIKDDGIVGTSGTASDGRGFKNFEADMRRNIRQLGHDFPRHGEELNQFQRRMDTKNSEKNDE